MEFHILLRHKTPRPVACVALPSEASQAPALRCEPSSRRSAIWNPRILTLMAWANLDPYCEGDPTVGKAVAAALREKEELAAPGQALKPWH
jgi:hypothetical protein